MEQIMMFFRSIEAYQFANVIVDFVNNDTYKTVIVEDEITLTLFGSIIVHLFHC